VSEQANRERPEFRESPQFKAGFSEGYYAGRRAGYKQAEADAEQAEAGSSDGTVNLTESEWADVARLMELILALDSPAYGSPITFGARTAVQKLLDRAWEKRYDAVGSSFDSAVMLRMIEGSIAALRR